MAEPPPRRALPGLFVLYLALAFALFGRHLPGGFLGDDWALLTIPRNMVGDGPLTRLASYWSETRLWWYGYVRPVDHWTWIANYALGGIDAPWIYYATNIVAHAAAGTALAAPALMLGAPFALAAWTGALLVAHPLAAEPVGFLYGRSDVLMAAGMLASLAAYARFARTGSRCALAASVAFGLVATFTKEPALGLLGLIVVLDLVAAPGPALARCGRYALFAGVGALRFAYRWTLLGSASGDTNAAVVPERMLEFVLLSVPRALAAPVNRAVIDAPDWLPSLVLAGLGPFVIAWLVLGARGWRAVVLGLAIVPATTAPLGDLLGESPILANYRYYYAAAAGVTLAVATIVWHALPGRVPVRHAVLAGLFVCSALALRANAAPWVDAQAKAARFAWAVDDAFPEAFAPGATVYLVERPANYLDPAVRGGGHGADARIHISGQAEYRAPRILATLRRVETAVLHGPYVNRDAAVRSTETFDPFTHDWSTGDRLVVWNHVTETLEDRTDAFTGNPPPLPGDDVIVETSERGTMVSVPQLDPASAREIEVAVSAALAPGMPESTAWVWLELSGRADPVATAVPLAVPAGGAAHRFTVDLARAAEWHLRGPVDTVRVSATRPPGTRAVLHALTVRGDAPER